MRNTIQAGPALIAVLLAFAMEARGQQPSVQNNTPTTANTPTAETGGPGLSDRMNRNPGPEQPLYQNSAAVDGQHAAPLSSGPQERSMLSHNPTLPSTSQPPMMDQTYTNQPRGELGVWLTDNSGPGVRISRITSGSAADRAGLRSGDVVLQVNGQTASGPQTTAQMIRAIPVGQVATLAIWRDGQQQQMQVTLEPAREFHRVGYPSDSDAMSMHGEQSSGDMSARVARLEQQLQVLTEELQRLQQQMTGSQIPATASRAGMSTTTGGTPESSPGTIVLPVPNSGNPPAGLPPSPAAGAPTTPSTPAPSNTPNADPFGTSPTTPASPPPASSGSGTRSGASGSLFQ